MRRIGIVLLVFLALVAALGWWAAPYARAAGLLVRVANAGGRLGAMADARAYVVTKEPRSSVPTRVGAVATQVYRPAGGTGRTILLIPGIHSMGIEEPRLKGLAEDLAATGHPVVTSALPDLQAYTITQRSADVIEDLVAQLTMKTDLAPDGRIGIAGISFAGGLSLAAAGRPRIRDHVAFVLSFGGHGDLPRVMHYLATGEETAVPGVATHPPHDYGVAVILYALAGRGVVPADQVEPLRDGVRTFLLASQLTLVSREQAEATFAKARRMAEAMPEPARTYMGYVNDRAVAKLGPVLVPFLDQLGVDDPALSPQRATPPRAPVFLLHGDEDTVIPPAESVLLGETLRMKGANVHVLLSHLITHAELDRTGDVAEAWRLIAFWADLLGR
jgi:pimeloyl-ACP methyl ester carboxylesterase